MQHDSLNECLQQVLQWTMQMVPPSNTTDLNEDPENAMKRLTDPVFHYMDTGVLKTNHKIWNESYTGSNSNKSTD